MKKQTEFRIKIAAQILSAMLVDTDSENGIGYNNILEVRERQKWWLDTAFGFADLLIQRGIEDEQEKEEKKKDWLRSS